MSDKINRIFYDDIDLLNKITQAFADLRADYDLSTEYEDIHISEEKLESRFVDIGILTSFIQKCQRTGGIVSGRRGTGKTHYLLLAHNRINNKWNEMKCLLIFINLKHLQIVGELPDELIERLFTVRVAQEFLRTITKIRKSKKLDNWLNSLFKRQEKKKFENCLKILNEVQTIAEKGEGALKRLKDIYGEISKEETGKGELSFQQRGLKFSRTSEKKYGEIIRFLKTQTISIAEIRKRLCTIRNLLRLDSIVFFLDEWSKLDSKLQEILSKFIDTINDDPIYAWLSIVPQRSYLGVLDSTADLPGSLDLDSRLIYERDTDSRRLTEDYFKKLIDKKLNTDVNSDIYDLDYSSFFGKGNTGLRRLRIMIWASMGNTRDFGILLGNAWEQLRAIRTGEIRKKGRNPIYIQQRHIEEAIVNLRENKLKDLSKFDGRNLLPFIRDFCNEKKNTHFVIPTDPENETLQQNELFKDLLYCRVIHLRRSGYPNKDPWKPPLNIYAIDLPLIYEFSDLKKKKDAIIFVTDRKIIHDRVRRYVLPLEQIIPEIEKELGKKASCPECGELYDLEHPVFKKHGLCPKCGEKIS